MRLLTSIFFLLLGLKLHAGVLPKTVPAYFSEQQFVACLQNEVASQYNQDQLKTKLREIDARRRLLASQDSTPEVCRSLTSVICPRALVKVQPFLEPIGCAINNNIARNLFYHSAALMSCTPSAHLGGDPSLSDIIKWQQLRENLDQNLNLVSDPIEKIRNSKLASKDLFIAGDDSSQSQRKCVGDQASPLARWLLEQPVGSVTHWQLLKKANSLYGDLFTSMAVIGEMFDQERMFCPTRNHSCVLGNKMKPLFAKDKTKYWNPVGDNYHFWASMNASLTESAGKEQFAAYLLEWLYKHEDTGHYSANSLGIHAGSRMTSGPSKKKSQCEL